MNVCCNVAVLLVDWFFKEELIVTKGIGKI